MPGFDKPLPLNAFGLNEARKLGKLNDPDAFAKNETVKHFEYLKKNRGMVRDDSHTIRGTISELSADYRMSLGRKYDEMEDGLTIGALPNPKITVNKLDVFREFLQHTEQLRAKACSTEQSGTTVATLLFVPTIDGPPIAVGIGVGDSSVLLLYRENSNQEFQIERLTPMHNPGNTAEKEWIKAAGGVVFHLDVPRLDGSLAVSRALGDRFIAVDLDEENSKFSQADITIRPIPANMNEVYGIVCSDGFSDALWNDVDIAHAMTLATQFTDKADFLGYIQTQIHYFDNSSVVVMRLPEDLDSIHYASVNDGHNGNEASSLVTRTLHSTYQDEMSKAYPDSNCQHAKQAVCITPDDFKKAHGSPKPVRRFPRSGQSKENLLDRAKFSRWGPHQLTLLDQTLWKSS